MPKKKIAFISTMAAVPWGGSEELWSKAAQCLRREGHEVAASVCGWPKPPAQLGILRQVGVHINERSSTAPPFLPKLAQKVAGAIRHRVALRKFSHWLNEQRADLICISTGSPADDPILIDLCINSGTPYTIITTANSEHLWPDDSLALQLIAIFQRSSRAYFVSQANRHLLEMQLGVGLPQAEIIRNPCSVRWDAAPPWPCSREPLRFACVGRLEPRAKGQDLILQVIASEPWRSRSIELSLYGHGPMEQGLRRLALKLNLGERVRFCGHEHDIERLWSTHHALILPSRFEGLPITIVDAMFCGRPVIVTNVAGNAELVEDGITGFVAEAPTVYHLNEAMERAWKRRTEWESIGLAAARAIRQQIPPDPAEVFARKLAALVNSL